MNPGISPVKAEIVIEKTSDRIPVMYNPPEYSVTSSATVEGSGSNVKFTKVETSDLTVELLFDTYEEGMDVRDKTNKISNLLLPSEQGKEVKTPPVCLFSWGNFTYKGIITKIEQKYTMFQSNGTPVRAKLNVTFKAVTTPQQEMKKAGKDNCRKVWIVKEGDRLDSIAASALKDPALWREIARENSHLISNFRLFPQKEDIGKTIMIPDVYFMQD